jgi:NAD(P)-dependent dehydrogenase (short-subunit alcohol dehydrogenase family)
MEMHGKIVVVTGATRGNGAGVLSRLPHELVVVD